LLPEVPAGSVHATVEALSQESNELRFTDVAEALRLAEAAVELAESLGHGDKDADLKAYAYAILGNARRLDSNLIGADISLNKAERLATRGTGSPKLRCFILDLKALVREAVRDFEGALKLIRESAKIREEEGDQLGLFVSGVKLANLLGYYGRPEEAVEALVDALHTAISCNHKVEETGHALRAAVQSLSLWLVEAEDPDTAFSVLLQFDRDLSEGKPLFQLKLAWLHGKIAHAFGRVDSAREMYRRVRDAYSGRNMLQLTALCSLDIALLEADAMRWGAALKAVAECKPILEALGIGPESVAAGLVRKLVEHRVKQRSLILKLSAAVRDHCPPAARHGRTSVRR
jgi:tetratricopeptide (TPR) repeat protein